MTSRHYSSDAKEMNILIVVHCFKIGVKLGGVLTLRYMGKQYGVPLILLSSVFEFVVVCFDKKLARIMFSKGRTPLYPLVPYGPRHKTLFSG